MLPTVQLRDRVLVDKAAYGWRVPFSKVWLGEVRMPARGDVVVLTSPDDGVVLLKRVVAIAGDRVSLRRGRLKLNGQPVPIRWQFEQLGTPHRIGLQFGGGPSFGPENVPAGHVLVVGDNRGNSRDGRSFGFVPSETILGRALGVYLRDGSLVWYPL